ncbi:MAG: GH116 family glycosyl hydrolase [Armatimonadota bacterium]
MPEAGAVSDCAWFRGGWFDALTTLWKHVAAGDVVSQSPHEGDPGNGGSTYLPFTLAPGEERTIPVLFAWYVPKSDQRSGADPEGESCGSGCCCGKQEKPAEETYVPWYAGRFGSIDEVAGYWRDNYAALRAATQTFTDCFYDSTLPPEVIEAAAANLTILKSPTCLRQADGRFWAWEGCSDAVGCCAGTCTHVWNYAQALPHLFPALERTLRETEFCVSQDTRGHQAFRASLPVRPPAHDFHAAADGQFGGIVKVFREWRISGDTDWLRSLWPQVKDSLDYCIGAWDPDHTGTLREPHHNTYDIEFWGADGMCTSFYLSALHAAVHMGRACGDDVERFAELLERGKTAMETALWNGEYFNQQVQWKDLHTVDPTENAMWNVGAYSAEARALLEQEGPKYQYGNGCLSDGVLGDWLARVSGLETVLDPAKVASHVASIFKYNFRESLADHANPQRPNYAFGQEAGLLLCSWPHGGELSLPFVYSNEVWTGIEYQVAAHLIMMGKVEEGLRVVRAVRDRYDGRFRNPFNEYECGHWYARAMSSYSLLQALTGARYDAVEMILYLDPRVPGDFRTFLATASGYATVGLRDGQPFVEVKSGTIEINQIVFAGEYQEVI